MLPRLNNYRSIFVLTFGLLFLSVSTAAQETTQYFRYFEVLFERSFDVQSNDHTDLLGEKPFKIHSSCSAKNSIIVKVPADYPKRVYQIENDLRDEINDALNSDKIKSLRQLKATEPESFCQ